MTHSSDPKLDPKGQPEPLNGEFSVRRHEFLPARGRTTVIRQEPQLPDQHTTVESEPSCEDLSQTNFSALNGVDRPKVAGAGAGHSAERVATRTSTIAKRSPVKKTTQAAKPRSKSRAVSLGSGTVLDRVVAWLARQIVALEEMLVARLPSFMKPKMQPQPPVKPGGEAESAEEEEEDLLARGQLPPLRRPARKGDEFLLKIAQARRARR